MYSIEYNSFTLGKRENERRSMEIKQHPRFQEFISGIKDAKTKAKILLSVSRLAAGNPGKAKSVGGGVSELKIDYGPGWRIYYTKVGNEIVLLLTGGAKNGQQRDIEAAQKLVAELKK
jgi:putative addiction module killer protein